MGMAQYKNAATPLSTRIQYHTSALSTEVCSFVLSQGAQKLSAIEYQMRSLNSKIDFSFLL